MSPEALADAAYCHAVLARYIEDPSRVACHSDASLSALDVRRLHQMAGLVTKVRHNPVRFRLPLTMRALGAARLEIDFFSHYAAEFTARRREGLTDEERTSLFVTALTRWLQPSQHAHRLVADVLAHELLMMRLAEHDPVPPPDTEAVVDAHSRPRLREGVHTLHLTVHPPDVVDAARGAAGPRSIDRTPRFYAYIPTPAGPRVKSIPPALAPLLVMADGSNSVAEMVGTLSLDGALKDVVAVFQLLVRRGLADLVRP